MAETAKEEAKKGTEAGGSKAWKRWLKRGALGLLGVGLLLGVCGGGYGYVQASAYDASMSKVYDVPPVAVIASKDPIMISRGEHLSKSLAGCATHDCHGADFGAGRTIEMGPVATLASPNITQTMAAYTDGELARLIRHGIKKDGRSVSFMPVMDFNWLSDSDVVAIVSYLRTVPVVERPNVSATKIKPLGKILDRQDKFFADVARRIDHGHVEMAPQPTATADYGKFVARLCMGCHGEHLSGGRIPGAPASMAIPLNLTPDATGLAGWTYADFEHTIETATRKNGTPMAALMPVEALHDMDDTERHALFAYLQ